MDECTMAIQECGQKSPPPPRAVLLQDVWENNDDTRGNIKVATDILIDRSLHWWQERYLHIFAYICIKGSHLPRKLFRQLVDGYAKFSTYIIHLTNAAFMQYGQVGFHSVLYIHEVTGRCSVTMDTAKYQQQKKEWFMIPIICSS